jgi:hypothetical protein
MLTLLYLLAPELRRAHVVLEFDLDFQVCCYVSLLGLVVSLAFLCRCGPAAFVLLASAS